ncbi:MAG: hypothetical protein ABL901_19710 [Hyphomicrobiaceae bacterium]
MNSVTPLDAAEIEGLSDTLDDEYKSREAYVQVVRDFGAVRPFIDCVDAEKCPDILAVYQALRTASLERHLSAFRRCTERSHGRGL